MECKAARDFKSAQFEFIPLSLSNTIYFKLDIKITVIT